MKCNYCERKFGSIPVNNTQPLLKTRDRIIPKSKGGSGPHNVVPACHKCNSWKSDKSLDEWSKEVQLVLDQGRILYNGYMRQDLHAIIKNIAVTKVLCQREIIVGLDDLKKELMRFVKRHNEFVDRIKNKI